MNPNLLPSVAKAALLLVLASSVGCAGAAEPSAPAGGAAPASTGPKVQKLVIGTNPPPAESNKGSLLVATTAWTTMPMYEALIGVTPEGKELVPELATEWKLEPDGRSFRFKLREGVPLQGSTGFFSAQDVVYTLDAMKKDSETEPLAPGTVRFFRGFKSIDIVNDHELVMVQNGPDAGFLLRVSKSENIFPITSKADGDSRSRPTLQDRPIAGTGPYAFVERAQGQYIRYKQAFEKHWRQTPDFPELEFRFIKESSTILAALLTKEIQIAALSPELVPQAEQRGFRAIQGRASGQHVFLPLIGVYLNSQHMWPEEVHNPDASALYVHMNTPLLDVRVRKALNKAIDRDALNKAFVRGRGEPLYNQFFNANRLGWNPAWQQNFKDAYGYDPEAAKRLLAEAGYGPGNAPRVTMQLRPYAYFPALFDMQEAIAANWRAAGFDVPLDQSDSTTYAQKSRRLDYDSAAYAIVTSVRQLAGVAPYQSGLPGIGGRTGVELPELEALYAELLKTLDPPKANAMWRQFGDIAYERYTSVPLFWLPSEAVVDPNVVADYPFPGSITGTYTHLEYVKAK